MRIIFFGTPEFAVPSLQALLDAGEEVVSVITQPDRKKGRGHKLAQPPVKEHALLKGLPVIQPSGIRTSGFYEELSGLKPDIIVVVAYGKIVPLSILSLPPLGCVNVHASLLPQYRGAAPIQWALINGEEKTGVTTMLMDEGLDTGDMLLKEEVVIDEEDNSHTLSLRLSKVGASLLMKTLEGLQNKMIKPAPQSGEATYAPPLKKEHGRIDWSLSARDIFNLIRGTFPWPGAYCYLNGEKLHIIRAITESAPTKGPVGRITQISGSNICVSTGSGTLAITEVRPEGKKTMTAAAFVQGRHLREGAAFETL